MSIEEEMRGMSRYENRCFNLVVSLVGAVSAHYSTDSVQRCIEMLSRYPHVLRACTDLGDSFAREQAEELERKVFHPGPTVVPDPESEGT